MSCYNYLVDKTDKLLILTGSRYNKETFLEDVEDIKKDFYTLREKLDYEDELMDLTDMDNKKIMDITVGDLLKFAECRKGILALQTNHCLFALFYFIEIVEEEKHGWDYVDENNLKEYKDYKEVNG